MCKLSRRNLRNCGGVVRRSSIMRIGSQPSVQLVRLFIPSSLDLFGWGHYLGTIENFLRFFRLFGVLTRL